MTYPMTYTASIARTAKAKTTAQTQKITEQFIRRTEKAIRKAAKQGKDVLAVEMPRWTDRQDAIKTLERAGYAVIQGGVDTDPTLVICW